MGIVAALFSAVCSTSKDIVSKKLAVRIDGTASTFASFAFALPFYFMLLGILAALGYDLVGFSLAFWWLVLLRALTDVFAEGMKMYAFAHGDVSIVTLFFSASPLILLVLSAVFTEDAVSLAGTLAVVIVVFGSLALVYRPSQASKAPQKKAILLAVGASVFFALNSLFDRLAMVQQHGNDPAAAVVAAFTMTVTSALLILPLMVGRRDRWAGMVVYRRGLLVRGMFEVAFMTTKLLAMQYLAAPYVVGLQRSSLLLSIIAGRVVFKERDFGRRLLAGLLILAGVLWIAWEKAHSD